MSVWERPILSYTSRNGRDKIKQWYDGLSTQEQADADVFIATQRKVRDWTEPQYKHLFNGIGELRWKSEKKQHRLLGFFEGDTWIALIGCYHKGSVYTPQSCKDTAKKRQSEVKNKEVNTVEFDL